MSFIANLSAKVQRLAEEDEAMRCLEEQNMEEEISSPGQVFHRRPAPGGTVDRNRHWEAKIEGKLPKIE